MEQFLSSYWWLVIIGIIIVGIVVKKILNMFISLIVVGVVLFVLWKVVISPDFSAASECLATAAQETKTISEKAKIMGSGSDRNRYICINDEASYNKLVSCIEDSKEGNPVAFWMYSKLPSFNKVFKETVESHNEACPKSTITKPDFIK